MGKKSVSELHNWFKEDRENVEDDEDNAYLFLLYQGYSQPSLLCRNSEEDTWNFA
jgi:hypothetical protein